MNLLSRPPEIAELPVANERQLCLPSVRHGTLTNIDPTFSVSTGLEDDNVLGGCKSEVCVIPDSPVLSVPVPDDKLSKSANGYGEAIMNAFTNSIVSLSKQDQPSNSKFIKTFAVQKEQGMTPFFNFSSKLTLPSLPQKHNQNPLIEFVAEKEQLLEDSDNELEVPTLLNNEECEQNNSHSPFIEQGHCLKSSPILNATPDSDTNTDESDSKIEQVERCEEPVAKKQKLETTECVKDVPLFREPQTSRTALEIDVNKEIPTRPTTMNQELPLPPPANNQEPMFPSTSIDQERILLPTTIDKEPALPPTTAIDQEPVSKSFPREPTEMADDGIETTEAALPTECARLHSYHPNLPQHPQHNLDYDSSDDDGGGAQAIVRPIQQNEPPFPEQAHEMSPSPQLTSFSPVLEYQVVPNVLPMDSSFSSKSLYPDEQSDKLEQKETAFGSVDSDSENMEHASVLAFALERMECQQNKITQTVCPSPPSDDDSRSVRVVSKQQQNCFSFRQTAGTNCMLILYVSLSAWFRMCTVHCM